ncbi:MAG: ABC transporter ATP-binding protein [Candidatus Rokuibacteriota bacterium]
MLRLEDVHAYYGKSHILQGVSMEIGGGELVAVLGRNGVGKTTLLKTIMGLVSARAGSVVFDGQELRHLPAHRIPRLGIGYVPQGRHIFPTLTVRENLKIGLVKGGGADGHRDEAQVFAQVFHNFPILRARLDQLGGTLSGGEQQMLAISRALLGRPKLIMLDEPLEGLMPAMVTMVDETVRRISEMGVSVLLVEQNVKVALGLANRVYILQKGAVTFAGRAQDCSGEVLLQHLGV